MFPSNAYVIRHAQEADAAVLRRLAGPTRPARGIHAADAKPSLRQRIREGIRVRRPVIVH